MALLTVQTIDRAGTTLTLAAATVTVGDTAVVSDDGRHFIYIFNGSGGSINVTVTAQTTSARQDGAGIVAVADIVKAVAAGATAIIPVLPDFIKTNDAKVTFVCSAVTTVTVAVVKLPKLA